MKKVLSLLLAFVFVQVQAHALSGGPVFGSGGGSGGPGLNLIGTYGGVLLPDTAENVAGNAGGAGAAATSIGLFSFAVNEAGPAVGAAVVFVEGSAYNGTITGIADPLDGAFNAIVDAISSFTIPITVPAGFDPATGLFTFQTVDTNVFATGSMTGTITSPTGGVAVDPITGLNAGTTRIDGTAQLDISFEVDANGAAVISKSVTYLVSGFKQSDTAAAATLQVGGVGAGAATP